jgi:hypothetical protein
MLRAKQRSVKWCTTLSASSSPDVYGGHYAGCCCVMQCMPPPNQLIELGSIWTIRRLGNSVRNSEATDASRSRCYAGMPGRQ